MNMCAYTQADTSAKVGFRRYRRTDPFGAAHLSGLGADLGDPQLGTYYLNRPFDPWELYPDVHVTSGVGLHGLGQNHPFKPQAWHLHGVPLDDAIPEIVDRVHEAVGRGDHATAQALVNTLNGLGSAPDQTTVDELVANGYSPLDIQQVIAQGATNEQLLALPYPASADERGAALYQLQHALGGAPGAAGVSMQPDIIGLAVQAGEASLGPAGALYSGMAPDAASQAMAASLGPVGALVATAKGTPTSVATAGLKPGQSMSAFEQWLAHYGGWLLLGFGGLIVFEAIAGNGGGHRRR
jgi:hypothetical protein